MKCLIAEDDLASRELLRVFLSEVSECDTAANGREAVAAVKDAVHQGEPYDLLCLDIMMPEMDGHQVLEAVREQEKAAGVADLEGVKVIMTTSTRDPKHVLDAFREGCEAFIAKPVRKAVLFEEMGKLGLLAAAGWSHEETTPATTRPSGVITRETS